MTDQPTQTIEVPGLKEWKAQLWEVNREIKSLAMLANVKSVQDLVNYVGWHGTSELTAILPPTEQSAFTQAMATLTSLLPSELQIEIVTKRKDELDLKRATLNQIKAMFE